MPTQLSRLHLPLSPGRVVVDRAAPGKILGVSILTTGPAKGHGFEIDAQTVERVVQLGAGIRGRWTHGALTSDALGRHLGTWSNLRVQRFQRCPKCQFETDTPHCGQCGTATRPAARALGDFAFSESAWKLKPDGLDVPAPDYLMARAEEDPHSLGISIVASLRLEQVEGEEPRQIARIVGDELLRADWVADPAANPTGLSQGGVDPLVASMDRLVARKGEEKARAHMVGFLARYFGDESGPEAETRGQVSDEPAPPAAPASPVPEAVAGELKALRADLTSVVTTVQSLVSERSAGLVSELRRKGTELGAPISAEDLSAVEVLLAQGKANSAQTFATALLSSAEGKAQERHDGTTVEDLSPTPITPRTEVALFAQAQVLGHTGRAPTTPTPNA